MTKITSRPIIENNLFLWAVQATTYIVTAIPLRLYHGTKATHRPTHHPLRRGALVVSNHQSQADPFLILAHLSARDFFRIIPVRFPTLDSVFTDSKLNPRWFPFLSFFGCFPIGENTLDRMRSIFYIRTLLKKKQTVMIFPEGKICRDPNIADLKRGVDFFMQDTDQVLFTRISGFIAPTKATPPPRKIVYSEVFSPPPTFTTEELRSYLETLS